MLNNNLLEFKILLNILADLVDESIISEWQAGLITGAYSMKNSIPCFDFRLYSSEDNCNIQNPSSKTKS